MPRTILTSAICLLCAASHLAASEIVFNIDPNQSAVNVVVTLITDIGSDTDSDSSGLTGTLTADLASTDVPFGQIHITDMNADSTDAMAFSFCVVQFIGCLAGVDATAAAGDLHVVMDLPAPAVPVTSGAFDQTGNQMVMNGIIDIDAFGLLEGVVAEGPTPFLSSPTLVDLGGTITRVDTTITLNMPISVMASSFDPDSGVTTEYNMTGTIVAHGEAPIVVLGDMNCDQVVDFTDVSYFTDALVVPEEFDACDLSNGDMNQNGTVDAADMQLFVNTVLGI